MLGRFLRAMPALGRGGLSVGRPVVLVGAPGGERRQVVLEPHSQTLLECRCESGMLRSASS